MTASAKDEIGELMCAFSRMIDSVRQQAAAAEKIAAGDMSAQAPIRSGEDVLGINLNKCIANINRMIADVHHLSSAAVEGNLSARTETDSHSGDYRKIVEGINQTLDAVVTPIHESAAVLREVAAGNLQTRVQGMYQGDHAIVKTSLNETVEALNRSFFRIRSVAEQVSAGAHQIAAAGETLSQGSTEQASSIEEITASMTQMAAQTKDNAVNANQANELATSAKEQAAEGNSQMQGMVKAMAEINESSTNISKIIKVIDEIAFQTNILALNAAVEAARAGQHGKGFAVVAEEVRNLAARSANAAKETTAMIEGSIKKTDIGTKIANDTAQALDGIVRSVTQVAALVGDIAAASSEQATAITQINQAINQVSQVVQTNSATAEESAAASEELASQAALLKEEVNHFKLVQTDRQPLERDGIGADVLLALEDWLEKRKDRSASAAKALPASGRIPAARIVLDDFEFGKY